MLPTKLCIVTTSNIDLFVMRSPNADYVIVGGFITEMTPGDLVYCVGK